MIQAETAVLEKHSSTKQKVWESGLAASSPIDYEAELVEVEKNISFFRVSDKEFTTLGKILEANPKDCYARFLLGRCYERKGLVDMATEQFNLMEKLEVNPETILKRLRHHIEQGEISQAFKMRNLAWKKAPDDPTLLLLQGLFLQEQGASSSAEAIFLKLLSRPDCPLGAATALAGRRMDFKRWHEAIELADRDLRLNPSYVPALITKSECCLEIGKQRQVISLLKVPLKEHPFNRQLNLLMYRALRHEGKYEEALPCALRNLAGSDWISYYEPAMDRVKEMLKQLPVKVSNRVVSEQGLEIDRTDYAMKFHFYLGWCYFDLHWEKQATEQTQKALDISPEFEPNWYQMGRIKEVLAGDLPAATACFKKAHELQHSDFKALQAYKRVKARLRTANRDLSLKIKNILRN